jgi:26S proteasome regulatory subunit N2
VVSKVYHHLGSFEDSLTYALGAGNLFDVMSNSEYVQTTIGKKTHFSHIELFSFIFFACFQPNVWISIANKE